MEFNKTLYERFFETKSNLVDISMMVVSVIVLAMLSNIRISLWPVPVTLQTFGVFIIAFFFGSRNGLLTILLYILAGLVGFSVFSGNATGVATLFGPTGGYIVGFLVCVYAVGAMIERGYGRTKISVLYSMVIGNLIIYFFGLIGLWFYLESVGQVTFGKVIMVGLVPFLIGDAIKIIGAMYLFPKLWNKEI